MEKSAKELFDRLYESLNMEAYAEMIDVMILYLSEDYEDLLEDGMEDDLRNAERLLSTLKAAKKLASELNHCTIMRRLK